MPVIGSKPFMLLGADVTHPTSRSESEPSVAAVVASMDRYAGRYSSRVVQQPNRCEIIRELQPLVQQLLLDFYRYNHQRKPEAIVFFRWAPTCSCWGCGDGQHAGGPLGSMPAVQPTMHSRDEMEGGCRKVLTHVGPPCRALACHAALWCGVVLCCSVLCCMWQLDVGQAAL
jgi:hypothetical protein